MSDHDPSRIGGSGRNREVFDSVDLVGSYNPDGGLTPAEDRLIGAWVPPEPDVLDLGVGTGRTTPALRSIAGTYVGLDFAPAMIAAARRAHPGADLRVGDAAELSGFEDASIDFVLFSYNGIDYIHPAQRRAAALAEIRRVLRPDGVVVLSSHNPRAIFVRVEPARGEPTWRAVAKSAVATSRATTALLRSRAFWRGAGTAIDRFHPLMTAYATPARLRDELTAAGFEVREMIGGGHPRPLRTFTSPWTYVAATRSR